MRGSNAYQGAYGGGGGGGGGTPGGSSGQVQYNNAGAFGGVTGIVLAAGVLDRIDLGTGTFADPAVSVGGSAAGMYLSAATTGILSFRENNYNGFRFVDTDGNIIPVAVANSIGLLINARFRCGGIGAAGAFSLGDSGGTLNAHMLNAGAATFQLGQNHATIATNQTLKAHNVTTGTGADLILAGGTGSVANGNVRFGTHSAVALEVVTGFIEIKDEGGTLRKLAVIS